ncbi:MAG: 3-oxoacyl-ACP reductase FabG [Chloroflexota bacterium]|nr:3-oxoacyl-ACP reductase FabG [Chloroflexota bacterium]
MELEGKVAIVTGGGLGIGRHYCEGLAKAGAKVVVADIAVEEARRTADQVGGTAVNVDVSDPESVQSMVDRALELTGRVDILVNNAARFSNLLPRKDFDLIPVEEWDSVMAVNVRGPWLCCKALAPVLRRQRSGSIVNISSGTIFGGTPGFMHYVTSKAALIGLTRCLARELGDYGVRVNAITPGLTSSESAIRVYPQAELEDRAQARAFKRQQTPEDLVGTVLFLCSDASAFITGQIINVDGGTNLH